MTDDDRPDFGPSGYLPERAAAQARKIILRAPLGLPWMIASVVGGVVLLVAGGMFLATRGPTEPQPPFERAMALSLLENAEAGGFGPAGPVPDLDVLLVGEQPVNAFADLAALDLQWCERSDQIEGSDDRTWTRTGRGLDGVPSLQRHPTLLFEGAVYVDTSRRLPGPSPSDEPADQQCR